MERVNLQLNQKCQDAAQLALFVAMNINYKPELDEKCRHEVLEAIKKADALLYDLRDIIEHQKDMIML